MQRCVRTVHLSFIVEQLAPVRSLATSLASHGGPAQQYVPPTLSLAISWCTARANLVLAQFSHGHTNPAASLVHLTGCRNFNAPVKAYQVLASKSNTDSTRRQHQQALQHLRTFHQQHSISTGGARKVIEEQQKEEEQDPEKTKSHQTQFDRSLKSRKAKTAEHQSVIAHMSDVRTPRSLLNKSTKQSWEVSHKSSLALYYARLYTPLLHPASSTFMCIMSPENRALHKKACRLRIARLTSSSALHSRC